MPVSKRRSDTLEEEFIPSSKRRKPTSNEMSLSQESFNWYQDHNYVTASVKIVQKNLKNYTAKFTDTGFSVYADGGLFWECKLCGTIVPNKCKLRAGSVRVEVRLKKQDLGQWSDYCGKNDSKVYNPVKILSSSDEIVTTAVKEEALLPPLSTPKDTNPQPLDDSNSATSIPNAVPDTQSDKPVSPALKEETSLPPSSTSEDTKPQLLPMDDSNSANSILDTTKSIPDIPDSIPDTTNSVPDTANSTPGSITDTSTANLVPDIETVPTSSLEPKMEGITCTPNSVPDVTVPDPMLDEDTEFIDFMNQPEPVELTSSSQERDATEPRRAAASFNISGADPIASSGDHAIDSNDVVVVPEATKDTELEISHLVHDWMDKIPSPVVEIIVPIRSFDANSLRVRFSVDSFKVIFKTRAEMFLKMIPGATENSYICWKPKLFGKIVPKESKHWVQMPKLYIQLKKAPPYQRWKSLEAPSSPNTPSAMEIPPAPRMGVSNLKSTTDTPPKNSLPDKTTRPTPSTPQNVAKPVDKQKSLSLAGSAGNAAAAVKAGTIVKLVDMSHTGLINIGNTCYMNSIIQSLSNTRELRDYLINGTFTKERNTTNPLGYKGKLVDTFASLLKKLWTGQHEKLSPHSILSLMASKYNQFTERSQHDAHEFMSFLLDGLHEDMNRVVVKPNTAAVEPNNRPDQEVAQEAWEVYRKRNDSFIVDTFQGQFKSTLYCMKCTTVSVTFDPFSCLAVPLPKKMRLISVILFRKDPTVTPVKHMFKLPHDSTVELLKASVGQKTGILLTKLRVFEAYKGKIQVSTFNNKMSIDRIGDKDMIIMSEVLSEQEAGGEVVEVPILQRILMPFHPTACAFCKKSGDADNLKRCTKCLAVAYCNRTCQEEHWKKEHKINCKSQSQPPTVGVPFIVSLPKKKCTYKNLANTAEKFARHSLNVERADVQSPLSSISGNGSVEKQSPQLVNNASEGGASSSSSTGGVSSPTGSSSLHSHIEEVPPIGKPDFIFTPVNRFGNTVQEGKHLEDIGERLLNLNNVKFLALDWKNNPKTKGYVKVTEKKQFYVEDSSCSTTFTDETESGPATLQKCLHLFTVPETLSSDEAWYCPKCKEHREAIKQMSLWRLPKILIIQLKRFTYQKCIWKDKIDKDVSFPLKELDMSKYVEEKALNDISVTSRSPVYDLYATVNHFGSVFFGHYTAYVQSQEDDKWLLYDDDAVRKCKSAEVNNQHAYLLFYRLRS